MYLLCAFTTTEVHEPNVNPSMLKKTLTERQESNIFDPLQLADDC